jgi:hypothetical protein
MGSPILPGVIPLQIRGHKNFPYGLFSNGTFKTLAICSKRLACSLFFGWIIIVSTVFLSKSLKEWLLNTEKLENVFAFKTVNK